jgi:hypothetical protein
MGKTDLTNHQVLLVIVAVVAFTAGAIAWALISATTRHSVATSPGQLELRAAQQAITTNWYAAYQRYVLGQ